MTIHSSGSWMAISQSDDTSRSMKWSQCISIDYRWKGISSGKRNYLVPLKWNTMYRIVAREECINEYIVKTDSWDEALDKFNKAYDLSVPRLVDIIETMEVLECDIMPEEPKPPKLPRKDVWAIAFWSLFFTLLVWVSLVLIMGLYVLITSPL